MLTFFQLHHRTKQKNIIFFILLFEKCLFFLLFLISKINIVKKIIQLPPYSNKLSLLSLIKYVDKSIFNFRKKMCLFLFYSRFITVMILNFRTDQSGKTVQTKIRLLLEEQSDHGLHCLLFHLYHTLRFGLYV